MMMRSTEEQGEPRKMSIAEKKTLSHLLLSNFVLVKTGKISNTWENTVGKEEIKKRVTKEIPSLLKN